MGNGEVVAYQLTIRFYFTEAQKGLTGHRNAYTLKEESWTGGDFVWTK